MHVGRGREGSKEAVDEAVTGDFKLGGLQGTRFAARGDPTGMLLRGLIGLLIGLPDGALILR